MELTGLRQEIGIGMGQIGAERNDAFFAYCPYPVDCFLLVMFNIKEVFYL